MESKIHFCENMDKLVFKNPVLIEGVPGVGLVAKIVATHIINSLNVEKFGEIVSPFFKDIAISTLNGNVKSPLTEFYVSHSDSLHDLVILSGNTQSLISYGQYELCGKILDVAQRIGCKMIICVEGLGTNASVETPKIYFTATDFETLDKLMKHNLDIFYGHISGMSGLLLGLAKLRALKGFCLLAETPGTYPDVPAAKAILDKLNTILDLKIDLSNLKKSAENIDII